jgi:hypothetical protein
MNPPPPKKILSVNFSRVLCSPLNFLTLAYGAERLSWNVGVELPLCACSIAQKCRSCMSFWRCVPQCGSAWSGAVLHMRIQHSLTYLSITFQETTSFSIQVNMMCNKTWLHNNMNEILYINPSCQLTICSSS